MMVDEAPSRDGPPGNAVKDSWGPGGIGEAGKSVIEGQ